MIDVECPRFGRELRPVDRNREAYDAFVRIVVLIHALSKVIVEIVRREVALCDGDRPDNGARQRGARRCGARVRFAPGSARRSREERQGRQQKREKRKKRSSDHEFAPKPLPQRLLCYRTATWGSTSLPRSHRAHISRARVPAGK